MRSLRFSAALLFCLALVTASISRAQFVAPTGYTYGVPPSTTGPSGPTNIYPDSGGELTNGVLGLSWNNYVTELDAAVWTGWANVSPTISFQFSTSQTFSRIEVGTVHADIAAIGTLTSVTLAGSAFTTGIAIADGTRNWLVFDQNFSTTLVGGIPTLTISLTTTLPSQWIMLDEVRFTAIPEPAHAGLLISVLAVGTLFFIRRTKGRSPRTA